MTKTTYCTFHAMTAAVARSALCSKYTAASKLTERDDDSASRNLWLRLQPNQNSWAEKSYKKNKIVPFLTCGAVLRSNPSQRECVSRVACNVQRQQAASTVKPRATGEMLPTQYMQTFVKHTSDASTEEWARLSILWNNYHANGAQLRKFATREPRCCETSVGTLAARWLTAGHLAELRHTRVNHSRIFANGSSASFLAPLFFSFGFGFFGISARVSWWLVRHLPQILNPEDELEATRVAINNTVTVLYLFTVPISSELFFLLSMCTDDLNRLRIIALLVSLKRQMSTTKFCEMLKIIENHHSWSNGRSKTFPIIPVQFCVFRGNPESQRGKILELRIVEFDLERGSLQSCSLIQDRKILLHMTKNLLCFVNPEFEPPFDSQSKSSCVVAKTILQFLLGLLDQSLRNKFFSILRILGNPLHDLLGRAYFSIPNLHTR